MTEVVERPARQATLVNRYSRALEVRFGGEIYYLPGGKTKLEDWNVPERLRKDIANQAMRQYGAVRDPSGGPEKPVVHIEWSRGADPVDVDLAAKEPLEPPKTRPVLINRTGEVVEFSFGGNTYGIPEGQSELDELLVPAGVEADYQALFAYIKRNLGLASGRSFINVKWVENVPA